MAATKVHPRSRGAAGNYGIGRQRPLGPSPLTRGSLCWDCDCRNTSGSIPAHAGQPARAPDAIRGDRVHPRSRGAASRAWPSTLSARGPSPLTRGSRAATTAVEGAGGSIPAHAGQPSRASWRTRRAGVHPRSRGAASGSGAQGNSCKGPSPLTRGSHDNVETFDPHAGSIPAHAGQPRARRFRRSSTRVHPRSRGAAARTMTAARILSGPSPLTRGSHLGLRLPRWGVGSIPAHAGQPWTRQTDFRRPRVHPRSRGAAVSTSPGSNVIEGPSPLTRGSPTSQRRPIWRGGSIPAHAGQPWVRDCDVAVPRVHPRSRGAASTAVEHRLDASGPSPLTRGSRAGAPRGQRHQGSIPAHAGQP